MWKVNSFIMSPAPFQDQGGWDMERKWLAHRDTADGPAQVFGKDGSEVNMYTALKTIK